MDRVVELLMEFLKNKLLLIVLLLLLIVSIIILFRKNKNVKGIQEQLNVLEIDYNTIKSMPLTFKLNKARSLAKVNDVIENDIEGYVESYDTIQKAIARMDVLFSDAFEAIEEDELDSSEIYIDEISGLITITLKNVEKLNEKLDDILKQELQLRSEVTTFKERYRNTKDVIAKNSLLLEFSEDVINVCVESIENEFEAFDEWMYISEFDKAASALEKIDTYLNKLDKVLKEVPELLPVAKEIIPNKIASVSTLYTEVRDTDLYLGHLDITQSLTAISSSLSSDLADLRVGDVDKVKESLDVSNKNLDTLSDQLNLELQSNDDLVVLNKEIETTLNDIKQRILELSDKYNDLSSRYEVSIYKDSIDKYNDKDKKIRQQYIDLTMSFKSEIPVSSMLQQLVVYNEKLLGFEKEIIKTTDNLDSIIAEEKRANQQLLKLYLIINEVSVKINEYQIPSISNNYKDDVEVAKQHVRNIEALLNEDTLNLQLLNSTLNESIDYVYKLYNNVNNIVGMALMVENSIVFANRYRVDNSDVDSELSKSELYFRNGEYTQALTSVLAVIEKLHPEDYEQVIRENTSDVG